MGAIELNKVGSSQTRAPFTGVDPTRFFGTCVGVIYALTELAEILKDPRTRYMRRQDVHWERLSAILVSGPVHAAHS